MFTVGEQGARRALRRVGGALRLCVWSAGAAAVVLSAGELAARRLAPDYLVRTRGLHVFSNTYGWASRAGAETHHGGKSLTLNSQGYRGRELSHARLGGATRVVVLGDSIAFGLGVSDDETFVSLLDRRNNGIEAGNLSVLGYGPDQELLLLREGLRYRPDVVILALCLANDLAEPVLQVSLYDGRTPKPRFLLVGDALHLDRSSLERSAPSRFRQWLSDYSITYNVVSLWHAPGGPPAAGGHWRQRYDEALEDEEYAVRLSLALIARMAELCRERGITFFVAAFPDRFTYRRKPALIARLLDSLAEGGTEVIDMSTHFRALGPRLKTVALDGTGHLSPHGHQVVAEVLEREIGARRRRGVERRAS